MFSNAAYMGFPLIQAIFGDEGLMYASVYVTVFNILLWTIGYAVVSGQPDMKKVAKAVLTNPVLYAVVLGLVIYLCRIPVPSVIQSPLAYIGNMNTPISMLITGLLSGTVLLIFSARNRSGSGSFAGGMSLCGNYFRVCCAVRT